MADQAIIPPHLIDRLAAAGWITGENHSTPNWYRLQFTPYGLHRLRECHRVIEEAKDQNPATVFLRLPALTEELQPIETAEAREVLLGLVLLSGQIPPDGLLVAS